MTGEVNDIQLKLLALMLPTGTAAPSTPCTSTQVITSHEIRCEAFLLTA